MLGALLDHNQKKNAAPLLLLGSIKIWNSIWETNHVRSDVTQHIDSIA